MEGEPTLCISSSAVYEALGGIQGKNNNWVWTSSPNISLNSTTGKLVTASGLWDGNGWVRATQTAGCEIYYVYNILVGRPSTSFKVNGQPLVISEASIKVVKSVLISEVFERKDFKDGNKVAIDVRDLPKGIYFSHVESKNSSDKIEKTRILLE